MSHYESEEEKFKLEVAELKDKIISNSTAVESNNKRIAASGFAGYAKRIWDLIKEDKDLDLPRERIMISEVRCNQIANENNKIFCKNESWLQVKKDIYTKATGFGEKVNSLIENCLSQYDEKALYFDETIRAERRERLIEDLLKVVEPIYRSLIERISHENMQSFKKSVDLEKEYMKKGKDLLEAIQDYVPDFLFKLDKQFADACIERANWDHATTLRQKKEDEAKAYVEARLLHFLKSIQDNNSEVGMTMKDLFIKAGTVGLDAFSVVFKALDHSLSSKISSSKAAMTPPETSSFPSPQKVAFHKIGVSPQTSLSPEQVLEVTKRVQAMSSLLSNKI